MGKKTAKSADNGSRSDGEHLATQNIHPAANFGNRLLRPSGHPDGPNMTVRPKIAD